MVGSHPHGKAQRQIEFSRKLVNRGTQFPSFFEAQQGKSALELMAGTDFTSSAYNLKSVPSSGAH